MLDAGHNHRGAAGSIGALERLEVLYVHDNRLGELPEALLELGS